MSPKTEAEKREDLEARVRALELANATQKALNKNLSCASVDEDRRKANFIQWVMVAFMFIALLITLWEKHQ